MLKIVIYIRLKKIYLNRDNVQPIEYRHFYFNFRCFFIAIFVFYLYFSLKTYKNVFKLFWNKIIFIISVSRNYFKNDNKFLYHFYFICIVFILQWKYILRELFHRRINCYDLVMTKPNVSPDFPNNCLSCGELILSRI